MSIYSVCEMSRTEIAVASCENICVWNLVLEKLTDKIIHHEENIKQLCTIQLNKEVTICDPFVSVDVSGSLAVWDRKSIKNQKPKLACCVMKEEDKRVKADILGSSLINGFGFNSVEVKSVEQLARDKFLVCMDTQMKIVTLNFIEKITQV